MSVARYGAVTPPLFGRSRLAQSPLDTKIFTMDSNSPEANLRRVNAGALTWRGPARMLFARAAIARAFVGRSGELVDGSDRTPEYDFRPAVAIAELHDLATVLRNPE